MKKELIAGFVFLAAGLSFAGDAAAFKNIGFSDDGKIYIFGQYGKTDVKYQPYAEIYTVDVEKNEYVPGGVYKKLESDSLKSGSQVYEDLYARHYLDLKKYNCRPSLPDEVLYILESGKKKGTVQSFHDMGLAAAKKPEKISVSLCLRSAVLVLADVLLMYCFVALSEVIFHLDLRFVWPFFKGFTGERFLQFFVYIPVFALFFILNNSKIMASARTHWTYEPGVKGFLNTWWRCAFMMAGGILIVILIEYIPFFAGFGPGADLLFGSTFGGPFMSLLIVFFPQVH